MAEARPGRITLEQYQRAINVEPGTTVIRLHNSNRVGQFVRAFIMHGYPQLESPSLHFLQPLPPGTHYALEHHLITMDQIPAYLVGFARPYPDKTRVFGFQAQLRVPAARGLRGIEGITGSEREFLLRANIETRHNGRVAMAGMKLGINFTTYLTPENILMMAVGETTGVDELKTTVEKQVKQLGKNKRHHQEDRHKLDPGKSVYLIPGRTRIRIYQGGLPDSSRRKH